VNHILVEDFSGKKHQLSATEGWRVMEIVRESGMAMKAECGGSCACATCHVYVAEGWAAALPTPSAEELGMLDFLPEARPSSRLACQILYTSAINGLEIALGPS
jgi:ferredoxin, 2Fe-2S